MAYLIIKDVDLKLLEQQRLKLGELYTVLYNSHGELITDEMIASLSGVVNMLNAWSDND